MHILQPKISRLKPEEAELLLSKLNVSRSQLPRIKLNDAALPEGCVVGDIVKIERKGVNKEKNIYYRVVVD